MLGTWKAHTGKGAKMRRTLNKTRFLAGKTDPENPSLWLALWMLQGTAFCRQNRPGQQQSVAAALDASVGYGGHHGAASPAVAPRKRKTGHGL